MGILALGADERVAQVSFTDQDSERRDEGREDHYRTSCLVSEASSCHARPAQQLDNRRWGLWNPLE